MNILFFIHNKYNLNSIFFFILFLLGSLNCIPGVTDNVCDTTSESNQNTIILKTLIGDNSPFCGVNLSNSSNQSGSSGTSTSPTTTSASVFYIYTDSITVNGNLGSRATSSNTCQTMQTTSYASLACTNHMALVSYSGDTLLTAAVPTNRPLLSASEVQVAADWNSYLTFSTVPPATISLAAAGVASGSGVINFWTSTSAGGNYNGSSNCSNNTAGTNAILGSQGAATIANSNHISFAVNQACDSGTTPNSGNSAYLVCLCWN